MKLYTKTACNTCGSHTLKDVSEYFVCAECHNEGTDKFGSGPCGYCGEKAQLRCKNCGYWKTQDMDKRGRLKCGHCGSYKLEVDDYDPDDNMHDFPTG